MYCIHVHKTQNYIHFVSIQFVSGKFKIEYLLFNDQQINYYSISLRILNVTTSTLPPN